MSERIPPHVDSGVAALLAEAPAGGVVKRSVTIAGHRTSVSLEAPFWDALQAIARAERTTVTALVTAVDSRRDQMAGNPVQRASGVLPALDPEQGRNHRMRTRAFVKASPPERHEPLWDVQTVRRRFFSAGQNILAETCCSPSLRHTTTTVQPK